MSVRHARSAVLQGAVVVERVLEAVLRQRGVTKADAMFRDTDRIELKFEAGRLKECVRGQEAGINLRIIQDGRVGLAGTTDLTGPDTAPDLIARGRASAEQGEECALAFPAAGATPAPET